MRKDDLRSLSHIYYGDKVRWFIGTVIDHTPPAGYEGRVKVRIHGVHSPKTSDIPERDLPWAQIIVPGTEGGISGIGRNPQILSGALVFGIFADGKSSQIPIIIGSLPRIELPTITQLGKSVNLSSNENAYDYGVSALIAKQLPSDISAGQGSAGRRSSFRKQTINLRLSEALKHFIDAGYTLEQASAIVSGLYIVSGMEPTITAPQGDLRGLANWKNTRLNNFVVFTEKYETLNNPTSVLIQNFYVQLEFILYELRTFKTVANGKLLRSRRLEQAVDIISNYYFDDAVSAESVKRKAIDIRDQILRG